MRPTRTLTGPLVAALAVAALAVPATAASVESNSPCSDPTTAVAQDLRSPDARDAAEGRTTNDTAAPPVQDLRSPDARDAAEGRATNDTAAPTVEITRAGGFDWTDATIGACGAAGLLAISLAGALTLRRRHERPRPPATTG